MTARHGAGQLPSVTTLQLYQEVTIAIRQGSRCQSRTTMKWCYWNPVVMLIIVIARNPLARHVDDQEHYADRTYCGTER